jgi:hypothetical protein
MHQIRDKRDSLREKIKDADFSTNSSQAYGGENDYNFKGLIN